MKKIFTTAFLILILICGSLFSLTACGNEDEVEEETKYEIFSLKDAFVAGYISAESVGSVAYLHNIEWDTQIREGLAKNLAELDEETKSNMKQAYLDEVSEEYPDAKLEDVNILKVIGTYGNKIAFIAEIKGKTENIGWSYGLDYGRVNINFNDSNTIYIWIPCDNDKVPEKQGIVLNFVRAYNLGTLKSYEVSEIAYRQNRSIDFLDATPPTVDPETIPEDVERNIKYAFIMDNNIAPDCNITVNKYYGIYDDCVVVMLNGGLAYTEAEREEVINGVTLYFSDGNGILVFVPKDKIPDKTEIINY